MFAQHFKNTYYDRLQTPEGNNPVRARGPSLLKVFEILEERQLGEFYLLETGCMRADHGKLNFGGDGCATIIFDDFMHFYCGKFISVDVNHDNVLHARANTTRADIRCNDSVDELWRLPANIKFDLIYLDSYDIIQANPHPSQLHHLKELCAVINKNTKPGTLIVVDDHDAFFTGGKIGKGNYVKDFMKNIGAKTIYEGYQIVFQL